MGAFRVLIIHEDHIRQLWGQALKQWFGDEVIVSELHPKQAWLPTRLLSAEDDVIILPLTMSDMASLTLAYIVNALRLPCKLILSSNTRAAPELLLRLFDAFIERSDGYTRDREWFDEIRARPSARLTTRAELEQVISRIIDEAHCFQDHHGLPISTIHDFRRCLGLNLAFSPSVRRRRDLLAARATIGVITALPKEFAAVRAMLEFTSEWQAPGRGAGRRYTLTEFSNESGSHVIAVALLPDMGTNVAAARATQLLTHLPNVRHIIMCGIAGGLPCPGVPEHDIRLGDVVVSDRTGVVQYDLCKLGSDGLELRNPPRPPSAALIEAARHLEAERLAGRRPWEPYLTRGAELEDGARPDDGLDASGSPIEYSLDPRRRAGWPRVFHGPIASANVLLKDAALRDVLRERHGVRAVEMEGSGIADASWQLATGYLVVRGICDYCDTRKGDAWQGYAAVAAAAYLRALLDVLPAE
jgi:nucleoside phosphorylase